MQTNTLKALRSTRSRMGANMTIKAKSWFVMLLAAIVVLPVSYTYSKEDGAVNISRFTLPNGATVIVIPADNSDIVAIDATIMGGSANVPPQKAGLEAMWLATATKGSKTYPKDTLMPMLEYMGTAISYSVDKDWSVFSMQCLKWYIDESMDIFFSLLSEPTLDESELELVRQKLIANAKAKKEQPTTLLAEMLNEFYYANHPYAADPEGKLETLPNITREDIIRHKDKVLVGKNLLIAVVGNVDAAKIENLLKEKIGKYESGNRLLEPPIKFTPTDDAFPVVADAPIATNYIIGKFAAPTAGTREYWAFKLGMSILSRKLWDSVRTQEGLSYAIASGEADNISNYGYIYVETINPAKALEVIHKTVKDAIDAGFDAEEIESGKKTFATNYFMQLEANSDIADIATWNELCTGKFRSVREILADLNTLSAEEIKGVMKKYMTDIKWAALGKKDQLPAQIFFENP